jgi:dTDP-4-dehydrorhamnose 3,5-epimerase
VHDHEFGSDGPVLIDGKAHSDPRGVFMETFRADRLPSLPNGRLWVQDNMSRSTKSGTVRGLHWQIAPKPQDKLICVLKGAILDVVVDLRIQSSTFGKAATFHLLENTNQQLLVPIGFAHGFCTLSDDTIVAYKCSAYYDPTAERSMLWCDPVLGIAWPVSSQHAIVSDKDGVAPLMAHLGTQDFFDL